MNKINLNKKRKKKMRVVGWHMCASSAETWVLMFLFRAPSKYGNRLVQGKLNLIQRKSGSTSGILLKNRRDL